MGELAQFLNERPSRLIKYARNRGFLHRVPGTVRMRAKYYVTEYGAMRLIAYIRAWQTEQWRDGLPILEHRRRDRLAKRAAQAKLKARALFPLANPGADTEDEGTEDRKVRDPV